MNVQHGDVAPMANGAGLVRDYLRISAKPRSARATGAARSLPSTPNLSYYDGTIINPEVLRRTAPNTICLTNFLSLAIVPSLEGLM
jgi:hypothetical protein